MSSISWGSWSTAGGNGLRVGIAVSWSAVTASSTTCTATVQYYVGDYYHFDQNQTLNEWGAISGTKGFLNDWGVNGGGNIGDYRLVDTQTYVHTLVNYGSSDGSLTFNASVSGAYNGSTPSQSYTSQIPVRPYGVPVAPSSVTGTYQSDTSAVLSWARNSTVGAPYQSVQVSRTQYTNGSGATWSTPALVATLSGSATSWTDNTISSNGIYAWHVWANNSAGASTAVSTSPLNTSPAAPSSVQSRVGSSGSSIMTSWVNNAYDDPPGCVFNVQRSVNGAAYASVATGVKSPWVDSSPGAGSNRYQVQAVSSYGSALTSAWVTGNTVSTIVAPLAPTQLAPSGVTVDFAQPLTLTWQHNDGGDGAPETAFSIQYSTDSGSTWTALATNQAVTGSGGTYTVPANTWTNGTTVLWQVQDEGVASAGFGPWSASATLTGSSTPVVTVTAPTGTVTTGHLTATWTYSQAQSSAQAQAVVTLTDANSVVLEQDTVSGAGTSQAFAAYAPTGGTYTTTVTVTSSAGLSATASATCTVNVPAPAAVDVQCTYTPSQGTTSISCSATTPGAGQDAVISASIARSLDGGATWVTLCAQQTLPFDLVDPLPTIAGQNIYRVTGASTEPAYAVNPDVTVTTPAGTTDGSGAGRLEAWMFLSWGPAFSSSVVTRHGVANEKTSLGRTLVPMLGTAEPRVQLGENVVRTIDITGAIVNPRPGAVDTGWYPYDSDAADWRAMGATAGIMCYRDCTGRRFFCVLSEYVELADVSRGKYALTTQVQQVNYAEQYGDVTSAPIVLQDNGDGTWTDVAEVLIDNGNGTWSWKS